MLFAFSLLAVFAGYRQGFLEEFWLVQTGLFHYQFALFHNWLLVGHLATAGCTARGRPLRGNEEMTTI